MSGELVGEVIAAAAELKLRRLSERGFHALIAIAEKCHHRSRQGSVPWSHIRAGLYGVSSRTAERAVCDLKTVGVLRVVKPGFNNNHGRVCAPIYEILPLTDTDTQMSESLRSDTDTQVTRSSRTDTDKPATDTDKLGDRYRRPGVVLNGSTNGSPNGESGAAAIQPLDVEAVPELGNALSQINFPSMKNDVPVYDAEFVEATDPDPEPTRYCRKHMPEGTDVKCGGCMHMRERHEDWTKRQLYRFIASAPTPTPKAPPPPQYSCNYCRDTKILLDSAGKPLRHRGELRICECNGIGRRTPQPGELAALDAAGNLDELKAGGHLDEFLAISSSEGTTE